jgi:hypothetical protein
MSLLKAIEVLVFALWMVACATPTQGASVFGTRDREGLIASTDPVRAQKNGPGIMTFNGRLEHAP